MTTTYVRWRRGRVALGACIISVASHFHTVTTAQAGAGDMKVEVVEGRLSVDVGAVHAGALARAIGELAGIDVNARGDVGLVTPQAFDELPLEAALRRLFVEPGRGLVVLYGHDATGDKHVIAVRLYEVKVAAEGGRAHSPLSAEARRAPIPPVTAIPPPPPPPPGLPIGLDERR